MLFLTQEHLKVYSEDLTGDDDANQQSGAAADAASKDRMMQGDFSEVRLSKKEKNTEAKALRSAGLLQKQHLATLGADPFMQSFRSTQEEEQRTSKFKAAQKCRQEEINNLKDLIKM